MVNSYCWLPAGNEDNASSRLRCYYLHRYFLQNEVKSKIGFSTSANVSIIQKRLDYRALFFSLLSWRNKSKIILDIDDLNPTSIDWTLRIKLFSRIVDGISAASDEQLKILKEQLSEKQKKRIAFFVFENPIDYSFDMTNSSDIQRIKDKKIAVCWFGNSGTFNLEDEVRLILKAGYNFLVISDKNPLEKNSNISFISWNRSNFAMELIKNADICILSHYGSNVFLAKSANKMIASIFLGVPVVASKTPSYTKIAKLCGVENFLYDTPQSILPILKKLQDDSARNSYIMSSRSSIIVKFSVSSVSEALNNWVKSIKKSTEIFIFNWSLILIYICFRFIYIKFLSFFGKKY